MDKNTTTFIVIRHAEKEGAGSDPNLNAGGHARAVELRNMLHNVDVSAIYATPYKRTKQTVVPLAVEKGLVINEYSTRKPCGQLVEEIHAGFKGKTVVIVGHTNTIPEILDVLSNNSFSVIISETQYNSLFIIHRNDNISPVVMHLEYGKH